MLREIVTKDEIRDLNKLDWDKKIYANFQFAKGEYGLEINYYIGDLKYKYKVICDNQSDMHKLRAELDENAKLVELYDGREVSVSCWNG